MSTPIEEINKRLNELLEIEERAKAQYIYNLNMYRDAVEKDDYDRRIETEHALHTTAIILGNMKQMFDDTSKIYNDFLSRQA